MKSAVVSVHLTKRSRYHLVVISLLYLLDFSAYSNSVVLAALSNNYTVSTTIKTVSTTILSAVKGHGELIRKDHKISNIVQKEIQTLSSIVINSESNVSQEHKQQLLFNSFHQYKPIISEMTPDTTATTDDGDEIYTCNSCKFREKLKASIMERILAKLDMEHPPNITSRPPISEHLLNNFYSKNGNRYIRIRNEQNNHEQKMQGDDPSVLNKKDGNRHETTSPEQHNNPEFSHNSYQQPQQQQYQQHHHHHRQHHHIYRYQNQQSVQNNYREYDRIDDIESIHTRYLENEYNDEYEYDLSNEHGLLFNMDYYDNSEDEFEDEDEAFYSITENLYLFPKSKCLLYH